MDKKVPLRQCMGCRERKEKKELIRVVRDDAGNVRIDPTGRANGRGAYVCRNADCIARAEKNKGFNRAFKVNIDKKVYEALSEEFNRLYG
ncbi:MAG: YlxR family protein [Lachnospiraceae bacterium]|nr:YlxR family protein [Lachnospiraceae bacterium]